MNNADGFTATEAKDGLHDMQSYTLKALMEGPSPTYDGPMARVSFSMSVTVPTGPYQNAKPVVTLEVPCHPAKIEAAYEFAQNWCDVKLHEMRAAIEASLAPGS